jgi:putative salt-induced outer membrane protein
MRHGIALLTFAVSIAPRVGTSADAPPPNTWVGKGQAGVVASQGNSVARSANAALDMSRIAGPWKHAFHLEGLYGQNAGIVSAERWDTQWQTNYQYSGRAFVFGALRYERDMFSGFRYQGSASAGVGYKIVDSKATQWSVQLGAGYRLLQPELLTKDPATGAVTARTPQATQRSAVATAGLDYTHALSGTTTLSNTTAVEYGSADTLLTNALALTVKVNSSIALSIGYKLQDNTNPPAGLRRLDSLETVNLVYSF